MKRCDHLVVDEVLSIGEEVIAFRCMRCPYYMPARRCQQCNAIYRGPKTVHASDCKPHGWDGWEPADANQESTDDGSLPRMSGRTRSHDYLSEMQRARQAVSA